MRIPLPLASSAAYKIPHRGFAFRQLPYTRNAAPQQVSENHQNGSRSAPAGSTAHRKVAARLAAAP
ncbi:hypothetical protein NPIL_432481, partial [Nephila pilipes]